MKLTAVHRIHMFDVGVQWSEQKKWIHCFESVTSIIFCTDGISPSIPAAPISTRRRNISFGNSSRQTEHASTYTYSMCSVFYDTCFTVTLIAFIQSNAGDGYYKYAACSYYGEGNDIAKCSERLWGPIKTSMISCVLLISWSSCSPTPPFCLSRSCPVMPPNSLSALSCQ